MEKSILGVGLVCSDANLYDVVLMFGRFFLDQGHGPDL